MDIFLLHFFLLLFLPPARVPPKADSKTRIGSSSLFWVKERRQGKVCVKELPVEQMKLRPAEDLWEPA